MKKLVSLLLLMVLAAFAASPDVSGKWSGTFTPETGDPGTAYAILKQAGDTLTGTAGPSENEQWAIDTGKIAGNKVTIEVKDPNNAVYKCSLTLNGKKLSGEVELTAGTQTIKAKLELTKVD